MTDKIRKVDQAWALHRARKPRLRVWQFRDPMLGLAGIRNDLLRCRRTGRGRGPELEYCYRLNLEAINKKVKLP